MTSSNYQALTQCDSLDDVKMHLNQVATYNNFLQNVPSPLSTSIIQERAFGKLIDQFQYIRSQATAPLSTLMDYITYGYMIDNVCLVITGALHGRPLGEMLEKRCHPLGKFDTIGALSSSDDITELYHNVLVDTPLAKYFHDCLTVDELNDTNVEIIRNKLYKAYYEDFYQFCKSLPAPSNEIMCRFIEFEADRRTINISLNAISAGLDQNVRRQLLPNLGRFYPAATDLLVNASDITQLQDIVKAQGGNMSDVLDGGKSVEDHLYQVEMEMCKDAFTQQFTFSTIWAWVKTREQEVRNITWISECIAQNQHERINNYISVF